MPTQKTELSHVSGYIKQKITEGECQVLPNPEFRAKRAYNILGLGKLFDGEYYCRRCTHTIDSNGYSVSLSLVKLEKGQTTVTTNQVKSNTQIPNWGMLKKGSRGQQVKELQERLNKFGYKLVVDGIFGSKTDLAVRDFQRKHGLRVDGIVGPETRKALFSSSVSTSSAVSVKKSSTKKKVTSKRTSVSRGSSKVIKKNAVITNKKKTQ